MTITTKKMANGTYAWVMDGETFPTKAVTPHGARVQGLTFNRRMDEILERSRKGWNPTDVTLEG